MGIRIRVFLSKVVCNFPPSLELVQLGPIDRISKKSANFLANEVFYTFATGQTQACSGERALISQAIGDCDSAS